MGAGSWGRFEGSFDVDPLYNTATPATDGQGVHVTKSSNHSQFVNDLKTILLYSNKFTTYFVEAFNDTFALC